MMKVGRNEPCPCGSGKKYKHCCGRKPRGAMEYSSELPGSAYDVSDLPVTQFLRQFDPLEVLIWLSATAAYPCNAAFVSRISLAMSLLLAAKGTNSTQKPQRSDIKHLIDLLEKTFGGRLRLIEDYIPFDNLSDLKLGWNGKMYRFFFGNLERPLAYTQKFIREYVLFDDYFINEYGFTTEDAFGFTLNYHDTLLNALVQYDFESPLPRVDPDRWYVQVPPPEFVAFWRSQLPTRWAHLRTYMSDSAIERGQKWVERYTHPLGSEFMISRERVDFLDDTSFTCISDHLLAPLPQFGISQLYEQFQGLLASSEQFAHVAKGRYRDYTVEQTWRLVNRLFSGRYALCVPRPVFANERTEAKIPICILLDVDKLFLVDVATSLGSPADLQRAFNESLQRISNVEHVLTQQSRVLPTDPMGHAIGRAVELPENLEVSTLVVLNAPVLDGVVLQTQQAPRGIFEILQLLELEAFALECKDAMEFCKFLRSWEHMKRDTKVIGGGILDAFAYYKANHYAFIQNGTQPNFVMLDPHSWSWTESEKLVQQAPIRQILNGEGVSDLAELVPIEDNAIRVFDRETRVGLMIIPDVESGRRLVLRLAGPEMSREDDVKMNDSLGEGIRFYFGRHAAEFGKFFDDHLDYECTRLEVTLLSETTARALFGKELIDAAFNRRPQVAISSLLSSEQKGSKSGIIVYNTDRLVKLLQSTMNEAERQLMNALLMSLLPEREGAIQDFVDTVIPLGKKALSIIEMTFRQVLDGLREPIEPYPDDISWANREIALQLKREGITPGRYERDEATRLNNQVIYPFLRTTLLDTIANYSATELLIRAYGELEQFESNRQQKLRQISFDAQTIYLEYDPVEKIANLERDTVTYISTLSTLIEIIVKSNPSGNERLSIESWHRVFALAKILFQTAIISEAIYFGVQSGAFVIDDRYGFSYEMDDNESPIDLGSFSLYDAELLMPRAAATVKTEPVDSQEYEPLTVRMPELIGVDKAFSDQFGVSLEDFLVMFVGLSSYPSLEGNPIAPLIAAPRRQIIEQLIESIEDLTPQAVDKALEYLVLTTSQLEHEEIEPWKLRSRRYRLTTRPIVRIMLNGEEMLLFGTWFMARCGQILAMYVEDGSLPLPDDVLSNKLREQLAEYSQKVNAEFEYKIRTQLRNDGYRAERMKPDRLVSICSAIASDNPGEIDAMFPQVHAHTIWIVEVKDLRRRVTPRDMKTEMAKFFEGEKSYSKRLKKKVDAVTKHLQYFLQYFQLDSTSSWQVRGAFVTSRLVPSAFAQQAEFPFYTLDTFLKMLNDIKRA